MENPESEIQNPKGFARKARSAWIPDPRHSPRRQPPLTLFEFRISNFEFPS